MTQELPLSVRAALDRLSDGLAALQLHLPAQSAVDLKSGVALALPAPIGDRIVLLQDGQLQVIGRDAEILARESAKSRWISLPLGVSIPAFANRAPATRPEKSFRPIAQIAAFSGRQLMTGRMDRSSRLAVAHAVGRVAVRGSERSDSAAGPRGGIVAHWHNDVLAFDDDGGILDLNPNTEGDPWPPQAMGMYYADAFAAYLFARRYHRCGDGRWRDRSSSALEHVARTYFDYPTSSIWYHHDFKNAAVLETRADFGESVAADLPSTDLICDAYEPANVFAVRAHWLALRDTVADRRRLRRCVTVLSSAVRSDGLLLDDRPGLSSDVRDLGYTGFMAGFLARYLDIRPRSPEIVEIQQRSLDLLSEMTTESGEIAFFGRGANSTYHLAAAAYALADGSVRFGRSDFRESSTRLTARLLQFQAEDGTFASACNDEVERRMGWNTCHTSYSALIGYFLEHTADTLATPRSDRVEILQRTSAVTSSCIARLKSDSCEAVLVAPGGSPARWSGHRSSGAPGIAYFGMSGEESILLLPDSVDGEEPLTNLIATSPTGFTGAHVASTPDGALVVVPLDPHSAISHAIRLVDSRLTIKTTALGVEAETDPYTWSIGLTGAWTHAEGGPGYVVFARGERHLRLSGPFKEHALFPVRSNPRGTGTLVRVSGISVAEAGAEFELSIE